MKKKPLKQGRAWKKRKGKENALYVFILLLTMAISMGMLSHSVSELALANQNHVSIYVPDTLSMGNSNSLILESYNGLDQSVSVGDITISVYNETDVRIIHKEHVRTSQEGHNRVEIGSSLTEGDYVVEVEHEGKTVRKEVKVRPTRRMVLTTDKPLYQPGQTVHVRTIVLDKNHAESLPVSFLVRSPDGLLIYKKEVVTDEWGIASIDYPLTNILPLGNYELTAECVDKSVKKIFKVDKYVLPKFKVSLDNMQDWYNMGENITGNLTVDYMFGKPVSGSVDITLYTYYGTWTKIGSIHMPDFNGTEPFHFDSIDYGVGIPFNSGNGYAMLNVTITDTAGHEETRSFTKPLAESDFVVTMMLDKVISGYKAEHRFFVRTPTGVPVEGAHVRVSVAFDEEYDWKLVGENETGHIGFGSVDFTNPDHRFFLKADVQKDGKTTTKQFEITPARTGIVVAPSKRQYEVGEEAHFTATFYGDSYTNHAFYDVISNGIIVTNGKFDISKGGGSFTVPVSPEMKPFSKVRVFKSIKESSTVSDQAYISVGSGKTLNVNISADQSTYAPREDVNLTFVLSRKGKPEPGVLGVSITDQAVFELAGGMTGFEKQMWGLEEAFVTPEYQLNAYLQTNGLIPPPSTSSEVILETSDAHSSGLLSEGTPYEAQQLEDRWVTTFWVTLFIAGIAGMIFMGYYSGIMRSSKKSGAISPLAALFAMLIITATLSAVLYTMTSSFSGSDSASPVMGGDEFTVEEDTGVKELLSDWREKNVGIDDDIVFEGGFVVPTDAEGAMLGSGDVSSDSSLAEPAFVRNYFPENWYWNPALITDSQGEARLSLTAPDSITTWALEAFASNKKADYGSGKTELTVFQEFFVEPDVPVKAVAGDEFVLKGMVYNYANVTQNVTVTLENGDWFEPMDHLVKTVTLPKNAVSSVRFSLKVTAPGQHHVKLTARSPSMADAVERPLTVVPNGKQTRSVVSGQVSNESAVILDYGFTENRSFGAEKLYLKIQPGMESVLMDGAEKYINFVHGCGEQSTSLFTVNVLAYKELLRQDTTTEELFEYETKVVQGIQHELMYLVDAGENQKGIGWFHGQDPDMWLTAWAMQAFYELEETGFTIDPWLVRDMQNFVLAQQQSDGSFVFPDVGHWSINKKLTSEELASTAYVVGALAGTGLPSDDPRIDEALDFLEQEYASGQSPYINAVLLHALVQAGQMNTVFANDVAEALVDQAVIENDTAFWGYDSVPVTWHRSHQENAVETTSYAVMGLAGMGGRKVLVDRSVRFILNARNEGTWGSTHDTAMALKAVQTVSDSPPVTGMLTVTMDEEVIEGYSIDHGNYIVTHYVDLIDEAEERGQIVLEYAGEGELSYQLVTEEYLPWDTFGQTYERLYLDVAYDSTNISLTDHITASVAVRFNGPEDVMRMALLDLRAPVGFSFERTDLDQLVEGGVASMYEVKGRQVVVYLENLNKDENISFSYRLKADMPLKATLQGVKIYDMYEETTVVELPGTHIEVWP